MPLAVENLTTKPEGHNSFVFSNLEIPCVLAFLLKNLTYFMPIWEATLLILVVWLLRFFSKSRLQSLKSADVLGFSNFTINIDGRSQKFDIAVLTG